MIDLISKLLEQLVSRYMLLLLASSLGSRMIEFPDTPIPIKVSYGVRASNSEMLIIRLLVDGDGMTFTMRNKLIATAIVFSLFLATYVAAQENNLGSQKAYAQGGKGLLLKFSLKQIHNIAQSTKNLVQQVKAVIMNVVNNQKVGAR